MLSIMLWFDINIIEIKRNSILRKSGGRKIVETVSDKDDIAIFKSLETLNIFQYFKVLKKLSNDTMKLLIILPIFSTEQQNWSKKQKYAKIFWKSYSFIKLKIYIFSLHSLSNTGKKHYIDYYFFFLSTVFF